MNNEFLPAYKVYQQVIDLELYYAFVDLVVHTSQEEKAWEIYRNIVDTQIWQQKAEEQNYFEAYNLRYPGEVLERFEEKLGKDVRIIRALALALGKTRALQSDNMLDGCLAAMKSLLSSTMGIQISGRRSKKNSHHPHHRQ